MPSINFICKLSSTARCKRRSPSLRITKDVLCQERIVLLWHGQLPFWHLLMFKKVLSLPNHSIRVCIKGKIINRGAGCGLEIPDEYILWQWEGCSLAKRSLHVVHGDVKEKVLRCSKKVILKKNKLFPTCVLFFLTFSLLGDDFHRNNPNRTWTFCPLWEVSAIDFRYLEIFL